MNLDPLDGLLKPNIMPSKFTQLTPMLETHDMVATTHFYTTILGFECDTVVSENMVFATFTKDEVSIMFTLPNAHRNMPNSIMSGSLYIKNNNTAAIWENIKDKCEICYPIEDFDYGMREFAIFDNNGYLLQFGQELG